MKKNSHDLAEAKAKLSKEKEFAVEQLKKKINEIEKQVKQFKEEATLAVEECQNLEKERRGFILEKEKMKERIKKLKMRKGKFDLA